MQARIGLIRGVLGKVGIRLGIFPALFFRDFFEGRPRLFLTAGIKLAGESFFVLGLVGLPLFLLGNCVVPVSTPFFPVDTLPGLPFLDFSKKKSL